MQHPNTSETIDLHANTNVGVHRVEARQFAGTAGLPRLRSSQGCWDISWAAFEPIIQRDFVSGYLLDTFAAQFRFRLFVGNLQNKYVF
jgi:hypothetical protein